MLWTAFLFGFLGSFHCVGMCGPIALALPVSNSGMGFISSRLAYNFGRIITYSILGLLLGLFGQGLQFAGLQQTISILSGVLILVFLFFPATTSNKITSFLGLSKFVFQVKQKLGYYLKRRSFSSFLIIGLLNGLLPCGFVYLALAASISAPQVIDSVFYMALFGLGTLPVMLLLAFSGKMLNIRFKSLLTKTIPYVACFLAILFILRGLSLNIPYISPDLSKKEGKTYHCH
jgi:sulfite exporter TauE/SafE